MKLRLTMVNGRGDVSITAIVNHRQLPGFNTQRVAMARGEFRDVDISRAMPREFSTVEFVEAFKNAPLPVQLKILEVLERTVQVDLTPMQEFLQEESDGNQQ